MLPLSVPRLLPATMLVMAALLWFRASDLARAWFPAAGSGVAHAAEAQAPAPTPAPTPAPVPAASPAAKPGPAPTPATRAPEMARQEPISDSERALLLDLRQRRQQLDAREAALASRETVLSAAQAKLTARIDELANLQARLESLERQRRERDEASWRGLVKLYESMKPREAAAIFNDLDPGVLLPVLDRMKESHAAAILAAMLPDRARAATAELAQMRTRANSVPPPEASPTPAKTAGG